jgi:hypothetical protein
MSEVRMQQSELTTKDLEEHPVWDYEWLPGQNEDIIIPAHHDGPADGSELVRTEFTLSDGTVMFGYIYGQVFEEDRTVPGLQPNIITPNGHVGFWKGCAPYNGEWLTESYNLLERQSAEIFPIKYRSLHPIINGPISGEIEFSGLDLKSEQVWRCT